ncbi:hypothetical protein G6F48_011629 [Rhizopus delemar]|nr:hypothetical protein G6F54_011659 [Rhizopus delemar]KAG1578824.1 hypothetical protein G6F48_011629 [Rhizopus delemar]
MAHFRAQQYDRALCLYIINAWLKVKPETVNGMLLDLPRNFDNKFTDVSQLNLEADESEMIVCCTTSTTNNEETTEGNIDETEENDNTEQGEQCVDIVVTTTVRNIPPCESEDEYNYNFLESIFRAIYNFHTTTIDIKDGEATFNSLFIYPFLEAVTTWLKESEDWCKAGFRHGETPLVSMGEQLKTLPLYKEDSHIYLADGIIKLNGVKNIEILLLETSGCFGSIDRSKIAFDHHKGLFGALTMLKNIADEFPMASMEVFQKCKVFFVHGAGKNLHLWSLRFEPEGPVFELWLEDILYIKPDIDDKLDAFPSFLKFFWGMKCLLAESVLNFSQLKKEHTEYLVKNRFSGATPSTTLSTIVNPSILKLTEEDDKTGMHSLGPFYCNPSSP